MAAEEKAGAEVAIPAAADTKHDTETVSPAQADGNGTALVVVGKGQAGPARRKSSTAIPLSRMTDAQVDHIVNATAAAREQVKLALRAERKAARLQAKQAKEAAATAPQAIKYSAIEAGQAAVAAAKAAKLVGLHMAADNDTTQEATTSEATAPDDDDALANHRDSIAAALELITTGILQAAARIEAFAVSCARTSGGSLFGEKMQAWFGIDPSTASKWRAIAQGRDKLCALGTKLPITDLRVGYEIVKLSPDHYAQVAAHQGLITRKVLAEIKGAGKSHAPAKVAEYDTAAESMSARLSDTHGVLIEAVSKIDELNVLVAWSAMIATPVLQSTRKKLLAAAQAIDDSLAVIDELELKEKLNA